MGTTCILFGVTPGSFFDPGYATVELVAEGTVLTTVGAADKDHPPRGAGKYFGSRERKPKRGAHHITTRSVRSDLWFTDVVPTEGSGPGSALDKRGHILMRFSPTYQQSHH